MNIQDQNELLLFAFEYPPVSGGIARLCAEIGAILGRNRVKARVLTQEGVTPILAPSVPEIRVDPRRLIREWQALRWLRKRTRLRPATQTATICGVWYPEGLISYLAGVRPLVILAHGAELLPPVNRWRRLLWKALQRVVLESADLVIANSEYTRELVSHVAPKAHLEAIPLAVDSDHFAPGSRDAARAKFGIVGKQVLCTVSRIERYKAHDVVLRAIAKLSSEERRELIYLVVGRGHHEEELKKLAVELGIQSHVLWLGFVSEQELPEIYQASDLFVLCTRDVPEDRSVEGFGLVFLEAQSCGIPAVGTRSGGIPSALRDGEGGWLIEQDDVQRLTDVVRQLVSSPESFRDAGIQARQRVLRESTWEIYGQRLCTVLQSVGIACGASKTSPLALVQPNKQGVSVVVPTLNRGPHLINTIRDLLTQKHRPIEILIVDQSSNQDPVLLDLIREHPELISYHNVQFRGLPVARNYGWQQAKYEAILFVDDDIRCGPSLAGEHLRALSQPNVGVVGGAIDEQLSLGRESGRPGRFNSWTATPERNFSASGECLVRHVGGCNFSAWRSALRAAGGFDEALAIGAALYEETEFCLRVHECGFEIRFNGSARLQHLAVGTGGCRVPDLPQYMGSLAHNRTIMIERHLRWFQNPVAYLRLFLLFVSYATRYQTLAIFQTGLAGLLSGLREAKQPRVCSQHQTGASR